MCACVCGQGVVCKGRQGKRGQGKATVEMSKTLKSCLPVTQVAGGVSLSREEGRQGEERNREVVVEDRRRRREVVRSECKLLPFSFSFLPVLLRQNKSSTTATDRRERER